MAKQFFEGKVTSFRQTERCRVVSAELDNRYASIRLSACLHDAT